MLSADSAEALGHVEGLETWGVAPTMVRGAKGLMKQQQEKMASTVEKVVAKKFFTRKRRPRKPAHAEPEDEEPEMTDMTAADFRRSSQGKAMIQRKFNELLQLDGKAFPHSPLFDSNGACRMKYEPAKSVTWAEMEACIAECLDLTKLGALWCIL